MRAIDRLEVLDPGDVAALLVVHPREGLDVVGTNGLAGHRLELAQVGHDVRGEQREEQRKELDLFERSWRHLFHVVPE